MGIEQSLERIASSLEGLVALQEKTFAIAKWHQDRIAAKEGCSVEAEVAPATSVAPADPAPAAPAEVGDDRKAREEEYDRLKHELLIRGVDIPPRTRMATLKKLWEDYKDSAVVAEEVTPPVEQEQPEEPAPTPMTREEARALITEWYTGSNEDQKILIDAFAEVGATKFTEVKDGDFDRLTSIINRLRSPENAGN